MLIVGGAPRPANLRSIARTGKSRRVASSPGATWRAPLRRFRRQPSPEHRAAVVEAAEPLLASLPEDVRARLQASFTLALGVEDPDLIEAVLRAAERSRDRELRGAMPEPRSD